MFCNSFGIRHHIACLVSAVVVLSTILVGAPLAVAASGPVGYGPADFQAAYSLPNWSTSGNSLGNALYRQGTVVVAGRVFLVGGNGGNGARSSVLAAPLKPDGTIGTWAAQSSLPRAVQNAAVVSDGASHIWVIGGDDGASVLSDVYVSTLDASGSLSGWTATSSLPVPVTQASSVFAAGHIIVTGGATQGLTTTSMSTIFVAATNANGALASWLPNVFSLPVPLRRHSTVLAGLAGTNYLVVTGGLGPTGQPTGSVYEGIIDSVGAVGQMSAQNSSLPVALFDHRSVFYKGNLVVAGGSDASGNSLGSVYYSPVMSNGVIASPDCTSASCWYSSYNALPQSLAESGLIASNGQLVVVGGLNSLSAIISAQVYTIPFNVATGTTLKGSPATVGVVMWKDDYQAEDELKAYRSAFNLPYCATENGCFKKILEVGVGVQVPTGSSADADEISMDIELASAICPNCHILLAEASDSMQNHVGITESQAASYGAIDSSFAPLVISNSYGFPEFSEETQATYRAYFSHPGVAITAAAGNGGYCGTTQAICGAFAGPLWPAVDPNVIAVAGTYLTRSGPSWYEQVWNNGNGVTASGCSQLEPKPTWQIGVTDAVCSSRMVADVSIAADGPQNMAHFSYLNTQIGSWINQAHGTSAASALVAGIVALSGEALGPGYMYTHRDSLHDIVSGNNVVSGHGDCGAGTSTAYYCYAQTGYDGPSGLGSPGGTGSFAPTAVDITVGCAGSAVAGGTSFSLALQDNGSVWAWGDNTYGQLGTGSTAAPNVNSPVSVAVSQPIKSVAAVGNSGIALTGGGNVWTWGYDSYGELGNGTTTGLNPNPTPAQVPNLSGIVAVSGGPHHVASLASDGTVWTWGRNASGQLGNSTTSDSSVPVHVLGPGGSGLLSGVSAVVAGGGTGITVAINKSDGTVWTWGDNSSGQLGTGAGGGNSLTPVKVVGPGGSGFLNGIVAIAASGDAVAALRGSDGSVWTWGWNYYGQLGVGSTSPSFNPVPSEVIGPSGTGFLTGVKRVVGGGTAFLALKTDGTVWGWGQDINGQLGDGNTTTSQTRPIQTKGVGGTGFLSGISDIAGSPHSLAVQSDGTAVYAWGYNHDGELGNSTTSGYGANPLPSQVVGPNNSGYLGAVAQPMCN